MSQTFTKEVIYTARSQLGEAVEIVDANWKDKYGLAVILQRHNNGIARFTVCILQESK